MSQKQTSTYFVRFDQDLCAGYGSCLRVCPTKAIRVKNKMEETISYLEKIEMGLLQNIEYIEFRTCREGCLGGVLTAIDKYLAKSAVQKMIKRFGLGRRLHRENILRMYEKGEFQSEKKPSKLTRLFGAHKEALSIDTMREIEKVMQLINGNDCTACGAPDCRTFAEDVVRGDAALKECLFVGAQKRKKG